MPRTVLERPDAVRALAEVFRRHGFESASLSAIQRESGIGAEQETFAADVHRYFADWVGALAATLRRGGVADDEAAEAALDAVAAIQGALVLGRALDDDAVSAGVLARTDRRLRTLLADHPDT
jgi:AcrR family transcriptional regulator